MCGYGLKLLSDRVKKLECFIFTLQILKNIYTLQIIIL